MIEPVTNLELSPNVEASSEKSSPSDAGRLERREGVCGGVWCVRGTRVPVWGLERCRHIGMSCDEVLEDYPFLQLADVLAAWNYASAHPEEISRQIQENEAD